MQQEIHFPLYPSKTLEKKRKHKVRHKLIDDSCLFPEVLIYSAHCCTFASHEFQSFAYLYRDERKRGETVTLNAQVKVSLNN